LLFFPISISAAISRDPFLGGGISPSNSRLLPERGWGYVNKPSYRERKHFTKKIDRLS
jgi:hypothetical protein